ncbi:MAG: triosephosphate isomerase [Desulfobulbus sp.]|nr:triosephosphate isomerase [Desulfobulbus sp.]
MKKMVVANWKAYLSADRARQWCDVFAEVYRPRLDMDVVIAVPALFMESVAKWAQPIAGVSLAAQGVSSYPQGSYTGSTPAAWLRGLARYTLIGHRERRQYFRETTQDVARQVYESLVEDLHPIVCFGRDQIVTQAAAMASEELPKLIWAYTPETPATLEMARSEADITAVLPTVARATDNRPILYGGGVTVENASRLWSLPGLSGIMLGKACLDAAAFAGLVNRL